MSLEIKRHLGEEIVLNGIGWIKPLTLKITNVYHDDVTLEIDNDDGLTFEKASRFNKNELTINNNKKLIRTPIEQIVFHRTGRALKEIMIELARKKMTSIDAAKELNINLRTFRHYSRKYKIKFIKLPPGWVRDAKENRGFSFKKKRFL